MEKDGPIIFEFDRFRLDPLERLFFEDGIPVPLAPRVFDTLELLVKNGGKLIRKERMLEEIWEGSFVEENNLAQNISFLRRVLGETKERRFIETIPKTGYRFVTAVSSICATDDVEGKLQGNREIVPGKFPEKANSDFEGFDPVAAPTGISRDAFPIPETHYVQNGDVNIAYQVVGEGDFDIVFVMGWVSHLEYFWKHHLFSSFLQRLSSFSRLILFDKRGTGLSDRVPLSELPTLEQRMEDVHAVMDAVGSERAVLVGVSEGGPMCGLFAATYPERTAALVMIGTYAKRIKDKDYPWGVSPEDREEFFEVMFKDWGKPVGIEERAPSMAEDADFRKWWATYLRMGASPGAAVALTKMNAEIDVRNVLPSVKVPTLVIHRKGDLCLKAEEGRYVASLIPDSRYIEVEGADHLPFVGNQNSILDEIKEFLDGIREEQIINRVLATIISVHLPQLSKNEEPQQEVIEFLRRQAKLFRGKEEVDKGRNEFVAAFDGPARAIRCARTFAEYGTARKVTFKIGLHTGECEVRGTGLSGFAVELAHDIGELSEPGTVLVSRTVKDLVAGSGLSFNEFGVRSFSGNLGEWRLFEVDPGH